MGWVVSVTARPRFSPRERTPGTHFTGGWVGPRAGLDTEARGKNSFCFCRRSKPDRPVVQDIVRHDAELPRLLYIYITEHSLIHFAKIDHCEVLGLHINSSPKLKTETNLELLLIKSRRRRLTNSSSTPLSISNLDNFKRLIFVARSAHDKSVSPTGSVYRR
jgi:hypothetical protein